ncbi:MAG TPA: hypothetical protein VD969_24725 [Symbiobacteriaceae bacterium]|nr:hypothetical protein [Symbiobacteriaceae bacterium]
MTELSGAKQLFLKYGGSLFQMDREGDYQRYRSFGVTKELELQWLGELRSDLLARLALENDGVKIRLSVGAFVDSIGDLGDCQHVSRLLEIVRSKVGTIDSFSQLMVAEAIARLANSCKVSGEASDLAAYAVATATEMLERIIQQPVEVADEDQANALLREVVQPHRIVERAQHGLQRLSR